MGVLWLFKTIICCIIFEGICESTTIKKAKTCLLTITLWRMPYQREQAGNDAPGSV